ncbi:TPA: recombinase family protein, partial [Salmonella enterica]
TKGCLIANFATVPSIARSTVYKILEDERAS